MLKSHTVIIPLFRSDLGLELELSGCTAALGTLSSLCARLSSGRDQRRAALEQLRCKHQKIQQFTQVAVSVMLLLGHP